MGQVMNDILFSSWGGEVVDNSGKETQDFEDVENISLPMQFTMDKKIKAMIGWYGLVLRSQEVNIVDLCRAYMVAIQNESCGKCFTCRIGTKVLADTLTKICEGKAEQEDLNVLSRIADVVREGSKCNIGQSGPVALLDALKYFEKDFNRAIQDRSPIPKGEYKYKLTAPCMDACPIHLDIPGYIECIKEGKFNDSFDMITCRLPIPGVVGRVCVRPCEEHCRRAILDEPISIKYLKRFVADNRMERHKGISYEQVPSEKIGKVAIIGAGPAGITCAYHLALKDHTVTIYERLGEPGGMAAMGIPDYRLPREILRNEVDQIQQMGVTIKYNTLVGKDVKLSDIEKESDAVFIAIGAQSSTSMRLEGEDKGYKGFIPGVHYLLDINMGKDPYPEGKKVLVVGGGNVAIDCVRSSYRIGKDDVNLVYRRTKKEMPADHVEIKDAEEEGVKFHYLTNPTKILTKKGKVVGVECIRMELGEPDESGRRRPVPVEGSEFVVECDILVPAIGQAIDLSLMEGGDKVETSRKNTLIVNEFTMQTSNPKIFSAGDCVTGPSALIRACAGGRKAAMNIDRMINKMELEKTCEVCFDTLFEKVKVFDPEEKIGFLGGTKRLHLGMLPPDERRKSFEEVEQGYSSIEAMREADRCLRCYRVGMVAV
ncbi:MAG: FAD-dependent oxidoreductase [Thermodesulfobacteriota bacterium]|nr:FAD-dependent oxidoreductase [Thermodesulfobacteriota bacterium]